jgi:HSP20 family protein
MAEPVSKLPSKTGSETTLRTTGEWPPLTNLRREIDRLFEDFGFGGGRRAVGRTLFDLEPFWRGDLSFTKAPAVDVVEKDKEYEITAELPGLDENNVEVKFADGFLTIKGEKRGEKEEKKKDYYLSERRFGSFQRSFQVPESVDPDKIVASFKNGVLTVSLPKSQEPHKQEKKIAIKKA